MSTNWNKWNWLFERKWLIKRWNRTFIPRFYTDLIQPPTYSYHLFYSHNATPLLSCFFRCCVLFSLSFSSPTTHSSPPPLGPVLSFAVRRELRLPESSPVPCDKCYYASWATAAQCLLMHGLKNQSSLECRWDKWTLICINLWYLQSVPNHKCKFTTLNLVYLCI